MGMHAGLGRHGERVRGGHLLRLDGRAGRVLRHEPHSRRAQRVSEWSNSHFGRIFSQLMCQNLTLKVHRRQEQWQN